MKTTIDHLNGALFQLKDKIKTANTPEMIEEITDSMIAITKQIQLLNRECVAIPPKIEFKSILK